MVHGHLSAEPSVTPIRPIADLAIADTQDIRQTIAGHVGEVGRLGAVSEHDPRPPPFLQRYGHTDAGSETFTEKRRVPGEGVIFGDKDIGDAIAGEINEPEIWIAPVPYGERTK